MPRDSAGVLALCVALLAPALPLRGQALAVEAPAEVRERLMHDLGVLAHDSMQGRAPGTAGSEMARVHLRERLAEMGLAVVEDTFSVRRRSGEEPVGVNLRVTVPGTRHPESVLALMAHYDHVGVRDGEIYNGADDNASGTAGLLELARELADEAPAHTMVLLFLDAEEGGLQGARHFVAQPSVALDRIVTAVNLDMVSHADSVLWVAGTWPWPGLRPHVERVEPAPPVRLRFGHDTPDDEGSDNWVGASDHAAFHREGIPFLYFGVADHPDYHRPTDDVETVNPTFFAGAVQTIHRVVRELDRSLGGVRPSGRP